MSKELKVGEVAKLTLKFRVEEATRNCRGCWGEKPTRYKCYILQKIFGSCTEKGRNIIFKLIKR